VDVVDVAVVVVVDVVARRLVEVRPDVRGQVRVLDVRARVDHGDGDALAGRDVPGGGQVDDRVGRDGPLLSGAWVQGRGDGRVRGQRDDEAGQQTENGDAGAR